jgi:dihydrofolate synthase/folylpolyglutamate synthase
MSLLEKFLESSSQEYTHMKLGLERVRAALVVLENPHQAYSSVLIAGTNGKGSVARILESVLVLAGHRVGLYTSPHLQRFTERIRVGGKEVEEKRLEEALSDFQSRGLLNAEGEMHAPSGERLTWFEKVTILAFEVFRRAGVSLAVLEVGLGGRLDATNVVDPLASAIVSVGLDHTEVLGNSLFEIAREKAGVMRAGKPLVLGEIPKEVREFLIQAAYLEGARPISARRLEGTNEDFFYGPYGGMKLGLEGEHQMRNAEVALELLEILAGAGFPVDEASLRRGLAEARHPGRLEWFPGQPPILLDGAHNPQAFEVLVRYLKARGPHSGLTILLGMMGDKDRLQAWQILKALSPRWILTEVPSPRTVRKGDWEGWARSLGENAACFADPREALKKARETTPKDGLVVVTGSLYLVGFLRDNL